MVFIFSCLFCLIPVYSFLFYLIVFCYYSLDICIYSQIGNLSWRGSGKKLGGAGGRKTIIIFNKRKEKKIFYRDKYSIEEHVCSLI